MNDTSQSGAVPDPAASLFGARAGTAMIVDDDILSRLHLRKILLANGCRVLEAADGREAIEIARRQLPDVVLADVMMPDLSGYELLQYLKSDEHTCTIPVILVTSCQDIEDLERGFLLGAFDYIRKPFNPREFVVRVRNALDLKRSNDELRLWKDRMSRELEMAGSLQRKLLQAQPHLTEEFDVRMAYQPSLNVGGDVFDAMPLPGGRLCVYVADAAGHGVGAAMVTILLRALINETAWDFQNLGPARICRELAIRFREHIDDPEIYATLFLAIYDPRDEAWRAMNCGHPAPVVLDPSGRIVPAGGAGGEMPLGFAPDPRSAFRAESEISIPCPPDTQLLLFTDGMMEALQAGSDTPVGRDGVERLLLQAATDRRDTNTARKLLRRFLEAGCRLHDDCSALSIRRLNPSDLVASDDLPLSRAALAAFAESLEMRLHARGFPDLTAGMARVLAMEHGANVIEHGGAPPASRLHCHVHVCDGIARLVFKDEGRAWNFEDRLAAALREPLDSERGRGLRMIQSIAHDAEVTRRCNLNTALYSIPRDWQPSGASLFD